MHGHLLKFFVACLIFVGTGCSGPVWQFPGGALSGEEQRFDLAAISPDGGLFQLETNPQAPYSVNLGYVVVDGNMYIDPTENRAWYQNIKQDPSVRIRLEGESAVYPAVVVVETDTAILEQFEADRIVLKLLPR